MNMQEIFIFKAQFQIKYLGILWMFSIEFNVIISIHCCKDIEEHFLVSSPDFFPPPLAQHLRPPPLFFWTVSASKDLPVLVPQPHQYIF